jgi:hypothetical protein
VREDIIKRERLSLGGHGGDEGVVFSRETGEKIGENLLITERSVDSSELSCEARDLVEEVSSGQITFLHRDEFHTDLHRARLRRLGELLLQGVPDFLGGLGSDDIPKNVLSHR